jgi:nitrogen fixation NifU-like protein
MTENDLQTLYEQKILHHNRSPYHCYKQTEATQVARKNNPLCGDVVTVYLSFESEKVTEASFESEGCALCKASASMMTQQIEGRTRKELRSLLTKFDHFLHGKSNAEEVEQLGELRAFAGVLQYPARLQCAFLPWKALEIALA